MKAKLAVIFILFTLLHQTARAQQGFAVVELFTSESRLNCPPAERILEKMAAKYISEPVYILEFHVDYENQSGWKDPYSNKGFTQRQRNYMQLLKAEAVVPQVIINGGKLLSEVDSTAMNAYIGQTLQQTTAVHAPVCKLKRSGQKIVLNCQADPSLSGQNIYAVLVQKQAKNSVTTGENRGRVLQHVNVVRDMDTGIAKRTHVRLSLTMIGMPNLDEYEVMVFTQRAESMQITSAVRVKLQ